MGDGEANNKHFHVKESLVTFAFSSEDRQTENAGRVASHCLSQQCSRSCESFESGNVGIFSAGMENTEIG